MFRGHNDLIQEFLTYIPKASQQSATLYVNKLLQTPPAMESTFIPNYYPMVEAPLPPIPAMETPVSVDQSAAVVPILFPPGPSVALSDDHAVPLAERHFFDQIRQSIASDEVYTQFIKLLDLYNRDILPLSELFAAVTDLLHIRHPAVSHLRNYLAQKGINEDEVPRTLVSLLDDLPHHASFLGADPRLQRTHSLLPRTASAGAATSGIAAILRGQPGAERRPGFPDDRVGGLVVHRACWISD